MVKRNLGGFLDLNNPPDFKNPQHQTNKKPTFKGASNQNFGLPDSSNGSP